MARFNENTVEYAAIDWLKQVGYEHIFGEVIAPEEPQAERASFREVLLLERLRTALSRLNVHLPVAVRASVIDDAIRQITRTESQSLLINNRAFHTLLTEGVDVSYREGGEIRHNKLWLIDWEHPERNQFLAVNQFAVEDVNLTSRAKTLRRPDLMLFINGLPLVIFEFKNLADEQATVRKAYNQLQTYYDDIPTLFIYNALAVISDGMDTRLGVLGAGWEHFKPWRTIDGEHLDPCPTQLETLIRGVCTPGVLLDLIRSFIVFEDNEHHLVKKVAAYHQYHAVNKAVASTLRVIPQKDNHRVGVIWHTQGSGKSLSMLFYAGKIIRQPEMANPTLVILTDRNDLDDQLFGTFALGQDLLRQTPRQADSRDHLRELLRVASGGVIFTTIQKFMPDDGQSTYPLLSDRHNIVFIADEAHRSQYGFEARFTEREGQAVVSYGFAKYVRDALPNASFIGFTGTPVETDDANTRAVFGDYIDTYDIKRAVDDGATVPIYYEARLAHIVLRQDKRPQIDPDFEDITEGEEQLSKERLKSKWSQLEAMVGAEERLQQVAQDIVTHFEQRLSVLEGKGMIVCMSRRIAVELYDQIARLRPDWVSERDDEGKLKVVMTGSASDAKNYQRHLRGKAGRKALAERFKDPNDSFNLVIVRDMWLTGFDVPPLHTMYIDKPMHGHTLMQAIARVNRVFRDKPGGLVVDYLGIAADLKKAIDVYTASGSTAPTLDQEQAVDLMLTAYDVTKSMFHRFDYSRFHRGKPTEQLSVIPMAMEHILKQDEGKKRYLESVARLSKAFALSIPHPKALALREDIAFFHALRSAFIKMTLTEGVGQTAEDLDGAVKQLVSQAITADPVVDLFGAAGLKTPDISILSEEFLEEIKHLPQKNVAFELLQKLINDEIKARSRQNVVQARSFADMLEQTVRKYQNRPLEAADIIVELIHIAQEIQKAKHRGEELGLNTDELAFYDALAENKSAIDVMGDKQLAVIALELVRIVRTNVTIDWTVKQSARARLKVLVKRVLRQYGYPPDMQEKATELLLEQAEILAAGWAG